MDLELKGRVALVTAASRGLGRATALALAREGAQIVIAARGPEDLGAFEHELRDEGIDVLAISCDMTEEDTPRRLVRAAVERFGRLDIVVSSNGGPPTVRALEVSDDALVAALNANMLSTVRLVREALPQMLENRWGRICAIASYSIVQAMPNISLSNAARSALWAWAKTAAFDLQGTGVTLNIMCPGPHATGHLASRPNAPTITGPRPDGGVAAPLSLGEPDKFGQAVAFLCSEAASYVSGIRFVIDGGKSLAL